MIQVTVPATSANLGPGFDCLGIALDCYATLWAESTNGDTSITGCPEAYRNRDNLALRAFQAACNTLGLPGGVRLHLTSDIPVARGMGSSAALTIAGLCAAWALHRDSLPMPELLALATRLEGHPDNAAPALLGGLRSAMMDERGVHTLAHPLHASFRFLALIPPFELSTRKARAALPDMVTHRDAAFNMAHLLHVLRAFGEGDGAGLGFAMQDRLHQPYRYPLIDGGQTVHDAVMKAGADACCISGAGPTLLAVYRDEGVKTRIIERLAQCASDWTAMPLSADLQGARVTQGMPPQT